MRRRERERSGRFVAEGEDLLSAADAAGWQPLERYCAAGSGLPGVELDAELLASVSGLGSGTRALAVYKESWAGKPAGPLCIYLHAVHDPGNVGTILRSAQAFAASSVALGPGSADPFSPKAVRASMGAIFSVPVAKVTEVAELPGTKIALVVGRGHALPELWRIGSEGRTANANVRERKQVTLLIGSERDGLPDAVANEADQLAHIPIHRDSLNAAMAATVALYEVTRMARS